MALQHFSGHTSLATVTLGHTVPVQASEAVNQYIVSILIMSLRALSAELFSNLKKRMFNFILYNVQGPVVQSIVSLTTSLRRHLVKYMPTTLSNTLLFFAMQKILTFFQQKITVYKFCNIYV